MFAFDFGLNHNSWCRGILSFKDFSAGHGDAPNFFTGGSVCAQLYTIMCNDAVGCVIRKRDDFLGSRVLNVLFNIFSIQIVEIAAMAHDHMPLLQVYSCCGMAPFWQCYQNCIVHSSTCIKLCCKLQD